MCDDILFVHGILGCDTTLHVHKLGRGIVSKKKNCISLAGTNIQYIRTK